MADVPALRNRVEQLVRRVLRVRGHKAQTVVAVNRVNAAQKLRKIHFLRQALAVGVHVLSKQRNFFVALLNELAALGDDGIRVAALLPAAHIRHNAVRAEIVAAVHHGHPRACVAVAAHRQAFNDLFRFMPAQKNALRVGHGGVHHLRQSVDDVRAEHDVHKRERRLNALRHALLFHHAAAYGNEQRRVAALHVFQRADVAEHAVFGVLANGTGVEQNKIGFIFIFREFKAHFREHTLHAFAVRHILLAAIRAHKRLRRAVHRAHLHDRRNVRRV